MSEEQDRVTQTIDRLISNLLEAVIRLKRIGSTSLARQIQNDLDNLMYWQKNGGLVEKERCEIWRKQVAMYKEQHGKDTNLIGRLSVQVIKRGKFKTDGCTCFDKPGDEYYCSVHGGEGSWIDLKVKSDMLIEKLGNWIVGQNNDVKESAASAFGDELKTLGKTLAKVTDENQ